MASWIEVQATLGRPISSIEQEQITAWIAQTNTIIKSRLGDLALLDPDILEMVITEAVANRVKRPDSATQVSVSVDDGQISRSYESGTGQIEILPQWWAMLSPTTSAGAFSVRPFFEAS